MKSQLNNRFNQLNFDFQETLTKTENQNVAIDSSGIKLRFSGQWVREKHKERKPFLKLHVAVNTKTNQAVAIELTEDSVSDISCARNLLTESGKFSKVVKSFMDGAYDEKALWKWCEENKIKPHIRLRKNARPNGLNLRAVQAKRMREIGFDDWMKERGMGEREPSEGWFSSFKRRLGEFFMSRKKKNMIQEIKFKTMLCNQLILKELKKLVIGQRLSNTTYKNQYLLSILMKKIKIAIVGVGNCASSLIQGIYYYKNKNNISGILHDQIGGYKTSDIEIVAAFDIDERKVGKNISEAIFQEPNNTRIFFDKIPKSGVKVLRGPTLDGFPKHMKEFPEEIRFKESKQKAVNVVEILRKTKPDLLINYLPVGSEKATKYYVNACLEAGVSFINAIPVFICSKEEYSKKFKEKGLVCLGDDIKAQVGATITHRVLTNLFEKRGVKLKRTYQLNFGGNTDFLNMLERSRLGNKKISKTESVQSQLKHPLSEKNIHIGPSDFIPWLKDNKVCQIRMEGEQFGGTPVEIDLRLSVEDSPNSAGVMIDAIRCAKLALDRELSGYLEEISAFAFKHPMKQYTDDEAFRMVEEFIKNE